MKKHLIILLLGTVLLNSCKQYLDLKPKNQVVVETMEDTRLMMSSYLYSISASLASSFNGKAINWPINRDAIANFAIYSDDLNLPASMTNSYSQKYLADYYEGGDWKGYAFANTIWSRMYNQIGFLNVVVKATEKFKGEPNYEMVRGEALAIRAYFMFKLLQYFAPYHIEELGIPLVLDPDIITGGARLPQSKVYAQIIGDLNEALNFNTRDPKWNVFNSKNVLHALLAQVYSFKAGSAAKETDDWKNAEYYSATIVNQYALETTSAELKSTFAATLAAANKTQPHALLVIGFNITPKSNYYSFFGTGNSSLVLAEDLMNSFDPNDIRYLAHFNTAKKVAKYTYDFSLADFTVLFRVAELYLLNTEANIRLKQPKGKQQLEAFILNRTGKNISIQEADLMSTLIQERRKEFFVENDIRWLDMKRLGLEVTRRATDSKTNTEVDYTLTSDDYRYAFPIPLETELNYNNIIKKNPNW